MEILYRWLLASVALGMAIKADGWLQLVAVILAVGLIGVLASALVEVERKRLADRSSQETR